MADEASETKHPEEEVDIQYQPIVKLAAVEVQTGEQNEEEIFKRSGRCQCIFYVAAAQSYSAGEKATLVSSGRSVALEK